MRMTTVRSTTTTAATRGAWTKAGASSTVVAAIRATRAAGVFSILMVDIGGMVTITDRFLVAAAATRGIPMMATVPHSDSSAVFSAEAS